jgi:hypothetical protein
VLGPWNSFHWRSSTETPEVELPAGLRRMVTPRSVERCVGMLASSRLLMASVEGSVRFPVVGSGKPTARSMSPPP